MLLVQKRRSIGISSARHRSNTARTRVEERTDGCLVENMLYLPGSTYAAAAFLGFIAGKESTAAAPVV
jgi:hypothetical protein